jgi:uncharacterized protein YjbK
MRHETEIKINLGNESNYRRLIDISAPSVKPIRQDNYFFDTDDWALHDSQWALRVRLEADRASLTLKGPAEESPVGLAVRPEIIEEISIERARSFIKNGITPADLPEKFYPFLLSEIARRTLRVIISFANSRIVAPWMVDDLNMNLEIDRTTFSDGAEDYELEVELTDERQYQSVIGALSNYLAGLKIPLIFQPESKLARAIKKGKNPMK